MIIELRHDTAANWIAANPTLNKGEFGVEDDTGLFKIGDAVTPWTGLAYANAGGGGGGAVSSVYGRIGAVVAMSGDYTFAQIGAKPTTLAGYGITDAATSAQGARADSAVQPGSLATVATSGAYSDLSGKPAIPTVPSNVSAFANDAGYLTQHQSLAGYALASSIPTNNNQLTNGAGYVTTDTTYSVATTSVDGLMSAADKTKLDGLGGGGDYTLPVADATTLGGVKIGANVTITGGVISVAAPVTDNAGLTNGAGYITAASLSGYALTSQLFSGAYADLSGKPTLGTAAATDATAYATAAQGAKADTAVQPGALATVATTGSYADLTSKPTIPAAQVNADWSAASGVAQILNKPTLGTAAATNATAYATAAQGAKADSAVQPAGLAGLATITGATGIAVVASLPGSPDATTLYFTTT